MSSRSSNNGGGGGFGVVGVQSIPAGSRKMVQSLKEIVNCPESEIYHMLKECNMDPNEAVNRLLAQDPFHEVKSKREKKKEYKDGTETNSRVSSNNTSRSGRSGTDRYTVRSGSTQFSSSDSTTFHGKPAHKKENAANSASSSSAMAGNNMNRRPPAPSHSIATENKLSDHSTFEGTTSVSQPSYQSSWVGIPGQVSMADIVKMGRSHGKTSNTSTPSHHMVEQNHVQVSTAVHHDLQSENHFPKMPEMNIEPRSVLAQHLPPDNDWVEEQPAPHLPTGFECHAVSKLHPEPPVIPFDHIIQQPQSQENEIQTAEDGAVEDFSANHAGSVSVSTRQVQDDNSDGASLFDDDVYKKISSYQPHSHAFGNQEVEGGIVSVSSMTDKMQQLSVLKEDQGSPLEENGPSVVFPNHLQIQTADCSHLSFGTFGSGISATFSGSFPPRPSLKNNLEVASSDADTSRIGYLDASNPEYFADESLRATSDGNLVHRTVAGAENFDSPTVSLPEELKEENSEVAHGSLYFPSSTPGYSFENAQLLNSAFTHSQTSSQMQNLAPFSNVMQAYTDSLPSTLLASTVNPGAESNLSYSPFPMAQSMAGKYGNTVSSLRASNISMPEALKTIGYSSAQPTAQNLSGSNVAAGPTLPQHIAMHPFSHPALPLGPFANMMGYPFLPQSYPYMPSAFQQAFGGNSIYHQSLAGTLPQFKSSVSVSSLPQSAAVASGYGNFGSSTTIPGNYTINPPVAQVGTTLGYEDVLNSQFKDNNHLVSLHQNENSAMWLHGPGSRTMSAVPASTYYSFQGQGQQPGGYRQGQQPSQNYGSLGYPNFYSSQSGISLEQQQNPRDGSLVGQGQPKQSQQIWQNGY